MHPRSSVLSGRYGVGLSCLVAYLACNIRCCRTRIHLYVQKAKLHHPDVSHKRSDSNNFSKILVAYQVLSNDRQRQLYDLSLKSFSSPVHNAAKQATRYYSHSKRKSMLFNLTRILTSALSSQPCRPDSTDTEQEGEWVPGAGWFAWAARTPQPPAANQIDKLRAELRHEFRAAVRHAYLGPRC